MLLHQLIYYQYILHSPSYIKKNITRKIKQFHILAEIRGAFKKYPDWFYLKIIRSTAVFVLVPVYSSYSPLSIDIMSSVELEILTKISKYILDHCLYTDGKSKAEVKFYALKG